MADLYTEEQVKKYPYLEKIAYYSLFIPEEEANEIENSEKIVIGDKTIYLEFLKKVLNDSRYYEYARKFFSGEISSFGVRHIQYGDLAGPEYDNKKCIIEAMDKAIANGMLLLTEEEQERFNYLKNKVTYEAFLAKHSQDSYETEIDGQKYIIAVKDIIEFMKMSDIDFEHLCTYSEIKDYNGIPKEYFIYACCKYFEKTMFEKDYILPSFIIHRLNEINAYQKIDIQAINEYLEPNDLNFKKAQINPQLEEEILKGMPNDASDLEKAIYIYIKMCKLLTYDQEFYAVNQKGPAAAKHKDINYVLTITLDNNEVVCYEFNVIYTKLLNKLGINCMTFLGMVDSKGRLRETEYVENEYSYSEGHAFLKFRCGKYLVKADSVTTILQGDIMQAKLNQELEGLECLNVNHKTQEEFRTAFQKMYRLVASQERHLQENVEVEHKQTFEELLEEYAHLTNNLHEVSMDEKISILANKIKKTGLFGIDTLSYVLQLRKVLFNVQEQSNNVVISIIRNNNPDNKDKFASAMAIIAINKNGFDQNPNETVYYYLNQNNELLIIGKDELQSMFDNNVLEYIESIHPRIPGINKGVGFKI